MLILRTDIRELQSVFSVHGSETSGHSCSCFPPVSRVFDWLLYSDLKNVFTEMSVKAGTVGTWKYKAANDFNTLRNVQENIIPALS